MSLQLIAAGVLALLAAVIHAVAGERTDIRSLNQSTVPPSEQVELRATWHIGSVALGLAGLVMTAMGLNLLPLPLEIPRLLAAQFIAFGLVWVVVAGLKGSVMLGKAPQWALLLGIGLLAGWGSL
jgi:hypothetical protein